MQTVQPIRDRNDIEKMKNVLKKDSYRNYMIFLLGINTGLRISDLLKLRVVDVQDRTHITIVEEKTKKVKRFFINPHLKKELDKYIVGLQDEEYLFTSRNGVNRPITRVQAYRILNKAAQKVGLNEIGTHSLRKTFGYFHYLKNKDVALLQEMFNHSAPSVTLRYIGINQDVMDESIQDFFL